MLFIKDLWLLMTIYTTLDLDESDFKRKNELRELRASDPKGNLIPACLLGSSAP